MRKLHAPSLLTTRKHTEALQLPDVSTHLAVRCLPTNAQPHLVSTQPVQKDIAIARRQHATQALRRHATNVRPQHSVRSLHPEANATARRQHATLAVHCLQTNAHPQLVNTQPAPKDIAIARRQHATQSIQ